MRVGLAAIALGSAIVMVRALDADPIELRISRETTYITRPLGRDGAPDYAAYLREQQLRGRKLEENALLPLAAADAELFREHQRTQALREMGGTNSTASTHTFVPFDDFARNRCAGPNASRCVEEQRETLKGCQLGGWQRPQDREVVQQWVERVRTIPSAMAAAAEKAFLFVPVGEWSVSPLRLLSMVRAVQCHAALSLDSNDVAPAMRDARTLWRFGGLFQGWHGVLLYSIGRMAWKEALAIQSRALARNQLDVDAARALLAELDRLDSNVDFAWVVRSGRIEALSHAVGRANHLVGDSDEVGPIERIGSAMLARRVDVNYVLRSANRTYDALERAAAQPAFDSRVRGFDSLESSFHADVGAERAVRRPWCRLPATSAVCAGAVTQYVADSLVMQALNANWSASLRRLETASASLELARIAAALVLFHSARGEYPSHLEQLVPSHLSRVPLDPTTNAPYAYRRDAGGYVLFVAGTTGTPEPTAINVAVRIGQPTGPHDD